MLLERGKNKSPDQKSRDPSKEVRTRLENSVQALIWGDKTGIGKIREDKLLERGKNKVPGQRSRDPGREVRSGLDPGK